MPFPFDVHVMLYSDNAPELENALHKLVQNRTINLVNLRREFYRDLDLDEIETFVKQRGLSAQFIRMAEAREYRQSVAHRSVPFPPPRSTAVGSPRRCLVRKARTPMGFIDSPAASVFLRRRCRSPKFRKNRIWLPKFYGDFIIVPVLGRVKRDRAYRLPILQFHHERVDCFLRRVRVVSSEVIVAQLTRQQFQQSSR